MKKAAILFAVLVYCLLPLWTLRDVGDILTFTHFHVIIPYAS